MRGSDAPDLRGRFERWAPTLAAARPGRGGCALRGRRDPPVFTRREIPGALRPALRLCVRVCMRAAGCEAARTKIGADTAREGLLWLASPALLAFASEPRCPARSQSLGF